MNRPKRVLDTRKPIAEVMESRAMAGSLLDALVLGVLADSALTPSADRTQHAAISAVPSTPELAFPNRRDEGLTATPVSSPAPVGEAVTPAESKHYDLPVKVSGPLTDLDRAREELWASSIGP